MARDATSADLESLPRLTAEILEATNGQIHQQVRGICRVLDRLMRRDWRSHILPRRALMQLLHALTDASCDRSSADEAVSDFTARRCVCDALREAIVSIHMALCLQGLQDLEMELNQLANANVQDTREALTTPNDLQLQVLLRDHLDLPNSSRIGSGNYGKVYKGTYNSRPVAGKILKNNMALLHHEENVMARLSQDPHPHVIRTLGKVLDYSPRSQLRHRPSRDGTTRITAPGTCVVMELMQRDLESLIRDKMQRNQPGVPPFSYDVTTDILLQIVLGMEHLHTRALDCVHRDLKPANVLVNVGRTRYTIKIVDFGLAIIDFRTGQHNSVGGTLGYMAPEIHETQIYCRKVDVFSFGMTAVHIITGTRPEQIPRGSAAQAAYESFLQTVRDRLALASCPQVLRDLIFECLRLEPADRPSFTDLRTKLVTYRRELLNNEVQSINNVQLDVQRLRPILRHQICKIVVSFTMPASGRFYYAFTDDPSNDHEIVRNGDGHLMAEGHPAANEIEYILNADDIGREIFLIYGQNGEGKRVSLGTMRASDRMSNHLARYCNGGVTFFTKPYGELLIINNNECVIRRFLVRVHRRVTLHRDLVLEIPRSNTSFSFTINVDPPVTLEFTSPYIRDLAAATLRHFISAV